MEYKISAFPFGKRAVYDDRFVNRVVHLVTRRSFGLLEVVRARRKIVELDGAKFVI